MARYCSTKYHRMARHIRQKQWVIERSAADKFDGDNKFFNGRFQTENIGNVKEHTNLFLLGLAPSGNNNFDPLKP